MKILFGQQFAKAYFNIALIYDQDNDLKNAIIYYDKSYKKMIETKANQNQNLAAKNSPDPYSQASFFKTCTNFAVCLEKSGQRERAMQVMAKLQQGNSDFENDSKFNINMGVLLQRQGDADRAVEYFTKATVTSGAPRGPMEEFALNFNLGITLMQQNRLQLSIDHFNKALILLKSENRSPNVNKQEVNAHKVNVYVNLALIYEKQQDTQAALDNISEALRYAPNNVKI